MSDFITAMSSLFTFLITQLGNIGTFFTTNLIGQIILGCALFGLAVDIVYSIIKRIKQVILMTYNEFLNQFIQPISNFITWLSMVADNLI